MVPNTNEWEDIQVGFNDMWNFPDGVIRLMARILRPRHTRMQRVNILNYKTTNSIVPLAVVDQNYCFKYIDVGAYGRSADDGFFQNRTLLYFIP